MMKFSFSGAVLALMTVMSGFSIAAAQTSMPPASPSTRPSPGALADTQIAKILMTINEGEIDTAKVAKSQAQNREVKDFANKMADQHERNLRETKDLVKRNKINPEDNDAAKALGNDAKDVVSDLKRQGKAEFDRAYLQAQIKMHEKALSTLDDRLIPSAQNLDFKAHLEKTRAAVSEHLAHARDLETKL